MADRGRVVVIAVLAALAALTLVGPAAAAPGQLDPSFGTGGVVKLFPSEEKIAGRAVATQPDGKIVIAGGEDPGNILVARLLPNGALDPSFGAGGKVSTPFPGGFGEARAVLVQPDGKILVAGEAKGAVNGDFVFARYDGAGALDPSFGGGDGIELVAVGAEGDNAEALALGPGGSIVATGRADLPGGKNGAAVVVLAADGTPNPGFAGDGSTVVTTAGSGGYDQGEGVAVLADGRILIADSTAAGAGKGFVLVRLLPSGAPDNTFGGDGVVETPIPIPGGVTSPGRVTDVALLADGRMVASGYSFDEVGAPAKLQAKFAAVRYLDSGDLDPSFGVGGIFTSPVGGGGAAEVAEVAGSGRLVLAGGYDIPPSNNGVAALRLTPEGTLDPAFGSGGIVLKGETAPFGEYFGDATLDAQEGLVIVSRAYIGNNNTEVVITRYGDPWRFPPVNQAPHARMKKVPKKVEAPKLQGFSGTASDPEGAAITVQLAVARVIKGGAKVSAKKAAPACWVMKSAKAKFKRVKAQGPKGKKRCPQRWLAVKGKAKWSFKLKKQLAPGRYVVYARAVDASGLAESVFSRKAGNRYAFRVLPPR